AFSPSLVECGLLAAVPDGAAVAAPALEPVRHYLLAGGADADAIDRRRCQLAGQLGRLFDEYASSRARMLADWRAAGDDQHAATSDAGGSGARARLAALDRWQRAVWPRFFAADLRPEQPGSRT